MGILDHVQKSFSQVSKNTKSALSSTKIEFKIRGYYSEAENLYCEIGKIIYDKRDHLSQKEERKLQEYYRDLDNIFHRIKNLEKALTEIKNEPLKEDTVVDISESKNHASLNKKEGDITIKRTPEGIRLLRFCPECRSENSSTNTACTNCGYIFYMPDEA